MKEKQRIRKAIAAEIRDSRDWLRFAKAKGDARLIHRFTGEINAFRTAAKIIENDNAESPH